MEFFNRLRGLADSKGKEQFSVWLDSNGHQEDSRSYAELWERSQRIAGRLQSLGVGPGDKIVLCFNFGLDFFDAFIGCMASGAVPVPIYPPSPSDLAKALAKMQLVCADCGAKLMIVDKKIETLRRCTSGWPQCKLMTFSELCDQDANNSGHTTRSGSSNISLESVAFLQYTSGSTGNPKGVVITYRNILTNVDYSQHMLEQAPRPPPEQERKFISWLPTYHDMGLVMMTLWPLLKGYPAVYLSPITFIKNPLLWLRAAAEHKCSITSAPNFGYGLVQRRFSELPLPQRSNLDLSCMKLWCSGAEPIRPDTVSGFQQSFRSYGLNGHFVPTYGLAEHTVAGCIRYLSLDTDPGPHMRDSSNAFVAIGDLAHSHGHVDIRIVDPEGREVPEGCIGEIWIRSASTADGYWNMPGRTEETFHGVLRSADRLEPLSQADGLPPFGGQSFLRTGDQGLIEQNKFSGQRCLHYCGRMKDMMIFRGRNLFPQDVEYTAEVTAKEIRPNCSAAFQAQSPSGEDVEAIQMICEVRHDKYTFKELQDFAERAARAIRTEHSVPIQRLAFIKPRAILKTTSGKIQRSSNKKAFLSGDLLQQTLFIWEDFSDTAPNVQARELPVNITKSDLQKLSPEERLKAVQCAVCNEFMTIAGLAEIDPSSSPAQLGIDSMMAAQFSTRLSTIFDEEVAVELLLESSSFQEIAKAIITKACGCDSDTVKVVVEKSEETPRTADIPVNPFFLSGDGWASPLSSISSVSSTVSIHGGENVSMLLRLCQQLLGAVILLLLFLVALMPSVAIFEHVLNKDVFQGLRLARYRIKPVWSGQVTLVQRTTTVDAGFVIDEPWIEDVYIGTVVAVLSSGGAFLASLCALTVLLKWTLLGRVVPGQHPLWSFFYWRRWLVSSFAAVTFNFFAILFPDGVVLGQVYRLLGAKIGRGAKVSCIINSDWDLISVGAWSSVSGSATLMSNLASNGIMYLQTVVVGQQCEVGDKSVIVMGVSIPDRTLLKPHTVITFNPQFHHKGCVVSGKPASVQKGACYTGCPGASFYDSFILPTAWAVALGLSISISLIPVILLDQQVFAKAELSGHQLPFRLLAYMAVFWVTFCMFTVAMKWLLLGRIERGSVVAHGSLLMAKRDVVFRMVDLCFRMVIARFSHSVLLNIWLRSLGANVHLDAVIGGVASIQDYDTLRIGPRVMIGGGTILKTAEGCPEGKRIVGVDLAADCTVGADCVIDCRCEIASYGMAASRTYLPPASQVEPFAVARGERIMTRSKRSYVPGQSRQRSQLGSILGNLLSNLWYLCFMYFCMLAILWLIWGLGDSVLGTIILWPSCVAILTFGPLVCLIFTKWVLIGRFKEGDETLTDQFGLRYLCILYLTRHVLFVNPLIQWVKGGPWANLILRSLGVKVEMSAYIATIGFFDPDVVYIGANAALNDNVVVAPHHILNTFDISTQPVHIESNATVWPTAHLFGGHCVASNCHLGPQSIPAPGVLSQRAVPNCRIMDSSKVTVHIGVPAVKTQEILLNHVAIEATSLLTSPRAKVAPLFTVSSNIGFEHEAAKVGHESQLEDLECGIGTIELHTSRR